MKKLTLDLDALAVQSFETTATPEERGTVRGNAVALDAFSGSCPTCEPIDTCTCEETGCGSAVPQTDVAVAIDRNTMYPGCTTVHTGCNETVAAL